MQDISKCKYEEGKMEARKNTQKTTKLAIYIVVKEKKKIVFGYTSKAFIQTRFTLSTETITVS